MPVVKVYHYPEPVLRQVCEPVSGQGCWDATTRQLLANLVDTMHHHTGAVGLSAPQIGVPLRVVAMDIPDSAHGCITLINPVIVEQSRNKVMREGCVSFPEYLANIKRAQRVVVQYLSTQGQSCTLTAEGLEAVAVQHEIDHLDGILMIDRIVSLKTDWLRRRQSS